ncbi:hypothetical protein SAMD00019534_109100 [Acytostelium subglobosum LB1]|uniref:hypothetical protein n=1 Tax=Acytostelium subglobosum LB1 TaxID=1410327 RepID=UPI000644B265|nr:hypothetical protein SAMD00019534_109100 [Acytostelium subglobosum LB1]GAM27734.1 hypothetical protein SAMD00019534_109100 [Acytostelium subglobosum LB1]|eukprot:XP_012749393.1 hypothetical protein SAMD00019534_109100 [Acytostelium subglobosum LB1]
MSGAAVNGVNVIKKSTVHIYRDCLRLARYIGEMNGFTKNIHLHIARSFREHKNEADQEKIEEYKTDATRFITNFMQHEAERLARQENDKKQKIVKPSPTLD